MNVQEMLIYETINRFRESISKIVSIEENIDFNKSMIIVNSGFRYQQFTVDELINNKDSSGLDHGYKKVMYDIYLNVCSDYREVVITENLN